MIKSILNIIIRLISLVCFLGQLILIYQIGVNIFIHKRICWLLLWYLGFELVLYISGTDSATIILFNSFFNKNKDKK